MRRLCTASRRRASGIDTLADIGIIRARLKVAEVLAQALRNAKPIIEGVEVQRSSGSVFADLGLTDTEKLKI